MHVNFRMFASWKGIVDHSLYGIILVRSIRRWHTRVERNQTKNAVRVGFVDTHIGLCLVETKHAIVVWLWMEKEKKCRASVDRLEIDGDPYLPTFQLCYLAFAFSRSSNSPVLTSTCDKRRKQPTILLDASLSCCSTTSQVFPCKTCWFIGMR